MKIFKYKFTKLIDAFIYIGIILSAVGFGANTYLVIAQGLKDAVNPVYPILQYSLLYLVTVALFVILISVKASSYYSIDGTTLKTSFGIIKSKYDISKIESIVLDRNTQKLAVYFDEHTFFVIVVKEEWYDEFISELLHANPNIEYSVQSKEPPLDKDEKK